MDRRRFSRARRPVTMLVIVAAGALGAVPLAGAHVIRLDEAQRTVELLVNGYASQAVAGFNEIRGSEVQVEVSARCRRASEHIARCTWRALVFSDYGGLYETSLALECSGGARVTLTANRLRAQRTTGSCVH